MQFKKGGYVRRKEQDSFRKILGVADGVFQLSMQWRREDVEWRGQDGLRSMDKIGACETTQQVTAYYEPCTASEAGVDEPKEKWRPEIGQKYYCPSPRHDDLYEEYTYDSDNIDMRLLKRGLVCQTPDEAIALAKKMLEVVKE